MDPNEPLLPEAGNSLSPEVRDFVVANARTWARFNEYDSDRSGGRLLVDVSVDDPKYIQHHCTIGNYVAKELDLVPLFVAGSPTPRQRAVSRSFYPAEFVDISRSETRIRSQLGAAAKFARSTLSLRDVDDLLDYSVSGVPIGDLVYSTGLNNTGVGSFSEPTLSLYRYLLSGLVLHERSKDIFEAFDIEAAVLSHFFYNRCGIIARTALKYGVDVHVLKAGTTVRRYTDVSEVKMQPNRPHPAVFEHVLDHHREKAISYANRFMTDRFGVNPETFVRRADPEGPTLPKSVSIEDSMPTALILPQKFTEPLRSQHKVFRDYLTWFEELLEFAAETDDTNWLIRPHPNKDSFTQEKDVESIVESTLRGKGDHTVTMLPEDIPHGALLPNIDVVLTLEGTAGMEYPCYGIPCVIGAQSRYSGFGFTKLPEAESRYFDLLDDVGSIGRLDGEARSRAKVMIYINFRLHRLVPSVVPDTEAYLSANQTRRWELMTRAIQEANPGNDPWYDHVRRYLRHRSQNLYDYSEIDLTAVNALPDATTKTTT